MDINRKSGKLTALSLLFACLSSGFSAFASATENAPTFDIWEYRVKGNTLLDVTDIEQTVYAFLGVGKTITDVEFARQNLERLYRDRGYPTVVVNIPEQEVASGIVKLEVTEGRIARLQVTGSRFFDQGWIRAKVPALAEGTVPYIPDLKKQLAALNRESGDRTVAPVLRPGRTPGTLEAELKVKDELPVHGSIELNGRNTVGTHRLRLSGSIGYTNLWQRNHSFMFNYQVSPQDRDEVEVFSGTYLMPVGDNGTKLALYAVKSDSSVAAVGTLAVIGEGQIFGLRTVIPLKSVPNYYHSLSLGVDYKDFNEDVVLLGADTLNTPISYTPFSVLYNGTYRGEKAVTRFGIGSVFSFRGLGNDIDEFEDKRSVSRPNFIHLDGNVEYVRDIWGGSQFVVELEGQVANSPLISNEQYSAGGAESVRGYYESQVLGDNGLRASLELHSPLLMRWLPEGRIRNSIGEFRALAFYDRATLRIKQPDAGQTDSFDIGSVGIGLRLSVLKGFKAALDVAWPIFDEGDIEAGDPRGHFSLMWEF